MKQLLHPKRPKAAAYSKDWEGYDSRGRLWQSWSCMRTPSADKLPQVLTVQPLRSPWQDNHVLHKLKSSQSYSCFVTIKAKMTFSCNERRTRFGQHLFLSRSSLNSWQKSSTGSINKRSYTYLNFSPFPAQFCLVYLAFPCMPLIKFHLCSFKVM